MSTAKTQRSTHLGVHAFNQSINQNSQSSKGMHVQHFFAYILPSDSELGLEPLSLQGHSTSSQSEGRTSAQRNRDCRFEASFKL